MNMQKLMAEAQKMQRDITKKQEELENTVFEGKSEWIELSMNGKYELKSFKITYDEDSSYYIDGNRTINNDITTLNINWAAGNIYVISNENQTSTIEIKEEITNGKDITNKLVVRSFIDLNTLNIQFGYPGDYEINDFRKDLHISLSNDYNFCYI